MRSRCASPSFTLADMNGRLAASLRDQPVDRRQPLCVEESERPASRTASFPLCSITLKGPPLQGDGDFLVCPTRLQLLRFHSPDGSGLKGVFVCVAQCPREPSEADALMLSIINRSTKKTLMLEPKSWHDGFQRYARNLALHARPFRLRSWQSRADAEANTPLIWNCEDVSAS